ncbi:hypothetical protein PTSG_10726 [Salpingoeca rosetta]|uniref:Uncharacterized protein n=1 Tax=Salpingoeca rosetta (strain ATCC 50818 / BSB-021) TaxID=946362 RepID=F2UQ75_SALR5|nr:uncharacterized protein PTSG_10726 [Salpingoeca rosetta]EGD79743.1 hypothetical protein PTSG_10726 [Salpingoeca rosetta]|eukprot:XP_004988692.1 hypothetical protein PTSG_10726 [Salpingoeca rosetta]
MLVASAASRTASRTRKSSAGLSHHRPNRHGRLKASSKKQTRMRAQRNTRQRRFPRRFNPTLCLHRPNARVAEALRSLALASLNTTNKSNSTTTSSSRTSDCSHSRKGAEMVALSNKAYPHSRRFGDRPPTAEASSNGMTKIPQRQ